jgi:hypothetical protein
MPALMLAPLIPIAIQAGVALGQVIGGAIKKRKAKKNRPEYEIPLEQKVAAAVAKNRASTEMPGYQQALQQIDVAGANALRTAAGAGGGAQAALASIVGQTQSQKRQLAGDSAEFRLRAESQYLDQLGRLAAGRDREFQINEFEPYAQDYAEGRDMIGAGIENLAGAAGQFALGKVSGMIPSKITPPMERVAQPLQSLSGPSGLSQPVQSLSAGPRSIPVMTPQSIGQPQFPQQVHSLWDRGMPQLQSLSNMPNYLPSYFN